MNSKNKKVLFILPHSDFRDKEYTWIKERLDEVGITSEIASSHLSEIKGQFGTLLTPDTLLSYVSSGDYDAFIFVGEEAAKEYYADPEVTRLVTDALITHKLVAAVGFAVPILTFSGQLTGRKVTGPDSIQREVEDAGAFYTGRLIEIDGDVITAHNPYSVRELAESIIKALEWSSIEGTEGTTGRPYLR